jgi:hypothetical protein
MRIRWLAALALAFVAAGVSNAQPAKAEPTVEVRLRSVNDLLDKGEYVAGLAGKEDIVKGVRILVKNLSTDGKGIEGVDPKRPFGLYATLTADLVGSPFTVMVPIADQDRFLKMLKDRFEITPEKVDGGALKVVLPAALKNPVIEAVYIRFADGYLYAARSAKDLDPQALITPKAFFARDDGSVASLVVRFDRIPADVKTFVVGQFELFAAEQRKKNGANESPAEKAFLDWLGDGLSGGIKTLFEDSKELNVRVFIDEKGDELSAEATLTPKPGTAMAKYFASLAGKTSLPAAIVTGKDAVARGSAKIAMPDDMKKRFAATIDDVFAGLVKQAGENEKEPIKRVLDTIAPTLKAGELDAAAALLGPDAKGRHTLLAAAAIKDGKEIEKLLKDFAPFLQGGADFDFDVDTIGAFKLHKITIGEVPEEVDRIFGTKTVWLAISDTCLALSVEPDGTAIKAGLKAKPVTVPVFTAEVSVAKLVPLIAKDLKPDEVKALIKDAFGDAGPTGKDTLTITLTGGEQLTAKAKLKGKAARLVLSLEQFKIK